MIKKKILKKPRTKQKIRLAKKRLAKAIKENIKKTKIRMACPSKRNDSDFPEIIRTSLGLRTYDPDDHRFSGVHAYYSTLKDFEWHGLLTIKFYSDSYSKDDYTGDGRKNRFDFLKKLMENLRIKFDISDREFNWFACEEFGFSGMGHLHALFSFDHLKDKNRMDRLKITDFSENGAFFKEGCESVEFISKKLRLNAKSVDFHWMPMWENEGLVHYFTKIEFGREEKRFFCSEYWKKRGLSEAA